MTEHRFRVVVIQPREEKRWKFPFSSRIVPIYAWRIERYDPRMQAKFRWQRVSSTSKVDVYGEADSKEDALRLGKINLDRLVNSIRQWEEKQRRNDTPVEIYEP